MNRLVVISGPANTGKMPLARRLCVEDSNLLLIHRDTIREGLLNQAEEGHITHLMYHMAATMLTRGYSICICAWNLEETDHVLWAGLANYCDVGLHWLDVREPDVAALIPPMGKSLS